MVDYVIEPSYTYKKGKLYRSYEDTITKAVKSTKDNSVNLDDIISGVNLLINSNFKGPINSSGKKVFSSETIIAGGDTHSELKCIDCWGFNKNRIDGMHKDDVTVSVDEGGITVGYNRNLAISGGVWAMYQEIENPERYYGEYISVSTTYTDGINTNMVLDLVADNISIASANIKKINETVFCTGNVPAGCKKLYVVIRNATNNIDATSAKFVNIQAEVGKVPTAYRSKSRQSELLLTQFATDKVATIDNIIAHNAASHNAFFRGKDLTGIYSIQEICDRIASGTFEDLYIGDYFDITISTTYTDSEVVRCVLAGFNTFYNNGDAAFKTPHAVIVPKAAFVKPHKVNDTQTTVGGYLNTVIHKTVLPIYYNALKSVFGNNIITYRNLLTNSVDKDGQSNSGVGYLGYSNGWEWATINLCLLSEIQVYGCDMFSSSYFDTGIQNIQLPIFRLDPGFKVAINEQGVRSPYWLKNVASASDFCYAAEMGHCGAAGAANDGGLRPYFCIG